MENTLREHAQLLLEAALHSANPQESVRVELAKHTFGDDITLVALGKASCSMAEACVEYLGDKIQRGVVITKHDHSEVTDFPEHIKVFEAGHPIPDEYSIEATDYTINMLKKAPKQSMVLFLISGGGSSLFTRPSKPVTLHNIAAATNLLLRCGASINEINALRVLIDDVKGGGIPEYIDPHSTVLSLVLSDVIGDDLSVIASGPTVVSTVSSADVMDIIEKYKIKKVLPTAILKKIEAVHLRTSKQLPSVENIIVGNNLKATYAARDKAQELGYHTLILSTQIAGEAREVAKVIAGIAKDIHKNSIPLSKPACVILGGETTVTIHGGGKGGRNQELALALVPEIAGLDETLVLTLATDGTDGPTHAAGAIADSSSLKRAQKKGLSPVHFLSENNSYEFFRSLQDLIITGPTGTNVNDLLFLLVK